MNRFIYIYIDANNTNDLINKQPLFDLMEDWLMIFPPYLGYVVAAYHGVLTRWRST
jgi:hypothetical protein